MAPLGTCLKNRSNASRPPAEAPNAAITDGFECALPCAIPHPRRGLPKGTPPSLEYHMRHAAAGELVRIFVLPSGAGMRLARRPC